MRCGRHEEGDGEEGDGHEAPPRHEEEGRAGGGADEGDAEEVSPSWALISKGRVSLRIFRSPRVSPEGIFSARHFDSALAGPPDDESI